MSLFRLVARGLTYHRRMHFGLLAGVVLACGILTGALIVGDSVKYSLREIAAQRLGRIAYAINWAPRLFAQDLADRMREQDPRVTPTAVLALHGMASVPSGHAGPQNQLNRVQVLGVAPGFWLLAKDASPPAALGPQEAAINEKAAVALGVRAGDDITIRVVKYGMMPLDAPLSSNKDDRSAASLVTVKAVLSDAQLGRFSLAANQTAPYNVFVDPAWLQEQAELSGLANLMLADDHATLNDLEHALDEAWGLEDVGLRLRTQVPGVVQLESARVFLEDEIVRAALEFPGAYATLTYLVNVISTGGRASPRATPYSFVEAGPVPPDLRNDETIINQWLAEQLGATPGETLDVAYLQLLPNNTFAERHRSFTVRRVVPMTELTIERALAPQFPGLSDVDNCRDWSIGMPMDAAKLSDPANEAYWRQYGQTPKLLVTLKAGQDMWSTQFGNVTAIRFPAAGNADAEIRKHIRGKVAPAKIGLQFMPVAQIARNAVAQAMDFGGLFVGMSVFLIIAALILLGLLYTFGIQQRMSEIGTLLAIGFPHAKVRALFLLETCPTAMVGALLGAIAGTAYAGALLAMLARFWPGAVAGTAIRFHVEPASLLIGMCATFSLAFLIVFGGIWRSTRHSARELLTTDWSSAAPILFKGGRASSRAGRLRRIARGARGRAPSLIASLALLLAAAIAVQTWWTKPNDFVEPFFTVGTLLLLAGFAYYWGLLMYLARKPAFKRPRLWKIAISNLARRRGRSLSVAGLTACGCFLVFSVSSMQENVALHANERNSGTGGFQIFAETTAPIVGAPADLVKTLGVKAVPLRVRDGDDAGCLNLNRAQTPRLFGVDVPTLSALGAFETGNASSMWKLLDQKLPDDLVPALVGDSNTALWGLQKKTGVTNGDVLSYRDESGREFKLKLVGQLPMRLSVFQGSILISDAAFTRLFPTEAGFRAFLIDAGHGGSDARGLSGPSGQRDQVRETAARLNTQFARFGMEAVPAVQRLREFYAVEATYLAMFLVLGGLGLVLGAGGVGVVVLRNVFERRAEIALLHAVGYERATVFRMLFAEHGLLVLAGMALGTLAAAASMFPLVLLSQTMVSPTIQTALLGLIIAVNLGGVAVVLRMGLSRSSLADLREE